MIVAQSSHGIWREVNLGKMFYYTGRERKKKGEGIGFSCYGGAASRKRHECVRIDRT